MLTYNINLHGLDQSLSSDYVEGILKKKFKRMEKFLRVQEEIKVDVYKEEKIPQYKMTIGCISKEGKEYNFKERGDDLRDLIDKVCSVTKETVMQGNSKTKDKKVNLTKKFLKNQKELSYEAV